MIGAPGAVQLVVRFPGGAERAFPLAKPTLTIGRASDNDIAINFGTVSRHHAQLIQHGSGYKIIDWPNPPSTNGLWVGGRRVREHLLRNGDQVRIPDELGNSVVLIYRDTSQPLPAAAPPLVSTVSLPGRPRVTLGRDPSNDVPLDYPTVSRRHASLDADGRGGHVLTDLGSTNGTFVNGQRVRRERLKPGDQVQIGPFKLLYDGASLHVLTQSRQVRLDGLGLTRVVRGHKVILNEVSLSIHPGDFVALVGGSGAGKTTLMNALCGFQPADRGQVLVNGEDFYRVYDAYRSMIAYVPQDDIIHLGLPVHSALRYVARLRLPSDTSRAEIERRIDEVLRIVDLTGQKKQVIGSLSGGQRKRVSIAVELLADPALLFLDEPTSGLDPGLEKRMMGLLQRLADEGRTVILVTHATANIDMADYVGFMAHGHLSFYGPPCEALQFFQVQSFADIYERLSEPVDPQRGPATPELMPYFQEIKQQHPQARPSAGQLWEAHFQRSPHYQRHVRNRLPQGGRPTPAPPSPPRAPRVSSLRQLWLLTRRYLELVRRDYLSLFVLLAVMPIIGVLLLIIAKPEDLVGKSQQAIEDLMARAGTQTYVAFGDAQKLLLMIALATVLLGIFGAAYEVIKESAIYKRERMVNLRILPYISSKVFVLLGFGLLQCLTLLAVVALRVYLPMSGVLMWAPLEMYLTLVLAVLAAIWLGLLISALVPRRDMVIYVVLLVLFLQIIFAGAIFKLPEVARPLSWTTITYWTLDALGSTTDMQYLDSLRTSKFEFDVEIENPVTKEKKTEHRQERQQPPSALAESDIYYGHTAKHLLSRWVILGLFSVLFGLATSLAMKLKDRR